MKKGITISFFAIYLFASTEIRQLIKLPLLIEHFQEHRAEDASLSLWEFLCLHYANGNVKDADYDKDMKLPFKANDGMYNTISPVFVSTNYSTVIQKDFTHYQIDYPLLDENYFTDHYLDTIWQPPKTA